MKKIKNSSTLQIVEEFKKYELQYRNNERLICHILNLDQLTKPRLLKIAKEMKNEKLTILSRDEQRIFYALKIWLCRNILLVSNYLLQKRFEDSFLDFLPENNHEYMAENALHFDEIVSLPKEVKMEKQRIDPQNEEFDLQREENQNKITEINFPSENLDFFSFEFIQELKFSKIFTLLQDE
jgi:hypothetical protein